MNWVVIFLSVYCTKTVTKELEDFICEDGTKINLNQLCDGLKHCPDSSDESKKLCYHLICPADRFRCYYGACITKNYRCDGKHQCVDGSDERQCGKGEDSCETSEFQCGSRECIETAKVCNDVIDCMDESDESTDLCEEFPCPQNTYRCKHGGCIHLDACCNGFQDCVDGSDESEILCRSLKCAGKECSNVHKSISCPPIISSRITVKCKSKPEERKGWLPCDKPLPVGTIAHYECKPYYRPATSQHASNTYSVCQFDGTWNRKYVKCEPECGRAAPVVTPLVVHGWIAEQGMWPWHATLYSLQNEKWTFYCGGSLISETVILTGWYYTDTDTIPLITAAHCMWKMTTDTIKVALGKFTTEYTETQDFTQIADVEQIIMQPLYQDILGNYGSDIAILIISQIIQFSPFVKPVCVDWELHDITEHLSDNKLGMIVGMGVTENDTFSRKLRATYLPVVSDNRCIEEQTRDFKKYVTYTSFCAGWRNGTGVCNGDSGGGLVFPKSSNQTEWVLQGIVSVSPRRLGTSFCDPKYYTIFTKVGMYVDWIHNVLNKLHPDHNHEGDSLADNIII